MYPIWLVNINGTSHIMPNDKIMLVTIMIANRCCINTKIINIHIHTLSEYRFKKKVVLVITRQYLTEAKY